MMVSTAEPSRKRRSPAKIAEEAHKKAIAAADRKAKRAERHSSVLAKAAVKYADELRREAERENLRQDQEDALDFVEGRDTPGAKRAGAEAARRLRAAKVAQRKAVAAGDPLNLSRHTTPPKLSHKEQKRIEKEEMEAEGLTRDTVRAADGSVPTVDIRGPLSLTRFTLEQQAAAEWLLRDMAAQERHLSSKPFEMVVSSGGRPSHAAQLRATEAVGRINRLVARIGPERYALIYAHLWLQLPVRKIHAMGGSENRVLTEKIKCILDDVYAFYGGARPRDRDFIAVINAVTALEEDNPDRAHAAMRQLTRLAEEFDRRSEPRATNQSQPGESAAPGLGQRAITHALALCRLERSTPYAFAMFAGADGRGIVVYSKGSKGKEFSHKVLVSGKERRLHGPAAIDSQLLRAVEAQGWKERADA